MPEADAILAAARQHYRDVDSVEFFRDGGNLSYVVVAGGEKRFLRAVRPAFSAAARRSADIHAYLEARGFPVPGAIPTMERAPYAACAVDDVEYLFFPYEYIPGDEPLPEDTERVGALVGRMHRLMQRYPGALERRDRPFFIDRYIRFLRGNSYPRTDEFLRCADTIWDRVRHLPRGYCHGDLYRGNLHRTQDGALYVLDFDTSCHAFPAYDVALFCNDTDYFRFDEVGYERTAHRLESFVRGYRTEHDISDAEVAAVYDLLAVYHFALQATIAEIHGPQCLGEEFLDEQLDWLLRWREQCMRNC